ncbi:MAG: SDR family NAD(P)-dependent oxidoreductase [Pseudohongiella sp.]|nr:SDR family NAD(P)-dependent oxidoreductase [Pseudohongiella sp.]
MNSDTTADRADKLDDVIQLKNVFAPKALVIGAGSAIAQALISAMVDQHTVNNIIAVSRQLPVPGKRALAGSDVHVSYLSCDYSAEAIKQLVSTLPGPFSHVFICTGVLHNEHIKPEKRIEDIDAAQMAELMHINSILPALWLQALLPVVKNSPRCVVSVFSARVGSISDNHKGGWYSYRASKAALNMVIKTAAIEYARRAPGVKLFAFHPGTVDTSLSRPFQKNVPTDKLFTPEFVAVQLLTICSALPVDGEASYLDWAGAGITW